jgi:YebC/PmpR family DNA-binding regulatory protein
MAGHSQFKNIMHRKGAQDAKRAKIFTKILREIITASKSGLPDPETNPRLRAAVQKARQENMPRDRVEDAIKRGSGQINTEHYEEIRYEGYGPGGVAVIVEALSDNRNRSASDIRAIFAKCGGNLGETGSVGFLFERQGLVLYPERAASEEAMLEAAIEAGAENCETRDGLHEVTSTVESFGAVRDYLERKYGEPRSARLVWNAKTLAPVTEEQAASLLRMIDMLEDHDDVQEVYSNADIASDVLERLGA